MRSQTGEIIFGGETMRFWDFRGPWLDPLRGPNGIDFNKLQTNNLTYWVVFFDTVMRLFRITVSILSLSVQYTDENRGAASSSRSCVVIVAEVNATIFIT